MKKNHPYLIREQVVKAVRLFFEERSFHEVLVPVLNRALPLEPNLYAFETRWHHQDKTEKLYLPTSPESSLKKILARGFEKVFAIAPSFRNLEPVDVEHHPEFLMLEWYRTNANYEAIMDDVKELIKFVANKIKLYLDDESQSSELVYQGEAINLKGKWRKVSLEKLFKEKVGCSFKDLSLSKLKKLAEKNGYQVLDATWEELLNQFFMDKIEPDLGKQPLFLTDFPSRISPLCKACANKPYLAERFEVYLGGLEIGNGNSELTDSKLVKKKFLEEQKYRQTPQLPTHGIDQQFLQALSEMDQTGQSYAGIGLGVERLAMILANQESLEEMLVLGL